MDKRPKKTVFKTSRQSVSGETKKFAAILIGCVLLVLTVSVLAILSKHGFDVKSALGGDAETVTVEETTEEEIPGIQGSKTYLFWSADTENDDLRFAWIVRFGMPDMTAEVCSLDLDLRIGGSSIRKIFASYGTKTLVEEIEKAYGISVDGYIGSDDESFKSMINYFGGISITVPEQIGYKSSDLTVILVKGRQNIKGDTLFKYLRYLGTMGKRGRERQSAVMIEILDFVFSSSNLDRRGTIFSRVTNTLETDLTIVDFTHAEEGVKVIMENGFARKKTVESPEMFAKTKD